MIFGHDIWAAAGGRRTGYPQANENGGWQVACMYLQSEAHMSSVRADRRHAFQWLLCCCLSEACIH